MRTGLVLRLTAWAIAVTLVALPLVGLLNGWFAADRWPVRQLQLEAEFANVSAEQIRAAAAPAIGVGFFAVDLIGVQKSVAQLPWVERVEARKRWPDTLVLRVYEQQPYAHWGEDRLVSREGRLFAVPGAMALQGLPQLAGPDERIAEVLRFYAEVQHQTAGTGLLAIGLDLSTRGSWTVTLDGGARIVVGSEDVSARLQRFLHLYSRVAATRAGSFNYVDLRYSNGFAMKWPTAPPTAPPLPPAVVPPPAGDA
ncbi:MAG: cell division protein FtsQ/DivIB [Tahibacter sp.]